MRRQFEARHHEGRIDAALKAIAGIGIDAELAAGLGDIHRHPQRRFDQHVGGGFRAAGFFAAHDAGERFNPLVIGDDAHRVVERVALAVERQHALAGARAAHGEIAAHLGRIEHMQRPPAVVSDEIGDIDQRIDWAQPDCGQPARQPIRRWPVLDAAHEAQRKGGA